MSAAELRGQAQIQSVVVLVIAIAMGVFVAGIMLPVGVDEVGGNKTDTLTQDVDTDYNVNAKLVSNVTAITDGSDATVELNDTRTTSTTSNTINVGNEQDYSLSGGTVTVGVESATSGSPNQATVNYTWDKEYEFSSGARTVWTNLDLFVVLGVLGLLIGYIRFR